MLTRTVPPTNAGNDWRRLREFHTSTTDIGAGPYRSHRGRNDDRREQANRAAAVVVSIRRNEGSLPIWHKTVIRFESMVMQSLSSRATAWGLRLVAGGSERA